MKTVLPEKLTHTTILPFFGFRTISRVSMSFGKSNVEETDKFLFIPGTLF
jgi:hypothetical protein